MEGEIAVNDLSLTDVMRLTAKRKKRYAAITLNEIEDVWVNTLKFSKEDPSYKIIRKAVLDNFNDLTRAWLRDIIGPVEDGYGVI